MNILLNKTILITGGTSRLGRIFVEKALQEQAKVHLTYYQNQKEAERLEKLGASCHLLDLGKSRDILQFSKQLKEKLAVLDILIHNAACVRDRTIANLTDQDWDEVFNVNLKAPYLLTKELLSLLLKNVPHPDPLPAGEGNEEKNLLSYSPLPPGEGRVRGERSTKKIFALISRAALRGGFGVSNYSASKAGLLALTKSLAQELGKRNILVNAINPGFMKSRMTEAMPEEAIQANLEASPLKSYSNPEEVADFMIYLCSDKMKQVTGQTFHFESRGMA